MAALPDHPLIQDFLDEYALGVKDSTFQNRRSCLLKFEGWLEAEDVDVTEMDPEDVAHYLFWLRKEGYAPNYVDNHYEAVRLLCQHLAGRTCAAIDRSPFEIAKDEASGKKHALSKSQFTKPESKDEARSEDDVVYVEPEEVDLLCENVPGPRVRNVLLIRLMFQTGLRESEVVEVETEDVDPENRTIEAFSKKTSSWRTVHYQPSLDMLLNQWIDDLRDTYAHADSPYLFVTQRAGQMQDYYPNDIIRRAAKAAGIEEVQMVDNGGRNRHRITSHALRHGHAVHALKSGVDVRAVQKQMGHAKLEMTMRYLKYVERDVRKAYKNWG